MVDTIFASLSDSFVAGAVTSEKSYYFSLGDIKKTVLVSADSCEVKEGKAVENADCVCKTSPEFFQSIWDDGYRPKMGDFLTGKIKSNDPGALKDFLKCFGKDA